MYLNFFPKTICKRFEVAVEFAAWQQSNKINKQTFRVRGWGQGQGRSRDPARVDVDEVEVGKVDNVAGVNASLYCMPMPNKITLTKRFFFVCQKNLLLHW